MLTINDVIFPPIIAALIIIGGYIVIDGIFEVVRQVVVQKINAIWKL